VSIEEVNGVKVVREVAAMGPHGPMHKTVRLVLADGTDVFACTHVDEAGAHCLFTGSSWQTVATHYRKDHEGWTYPSKQAKERRDEKVLTSASVLPAKWSQTTLGDLVVQMQAYESEIARLNRLLETRTVERDALREQLVQARKEKKVLDGIATYIRSQINNSEG
jgi:hypothetical protein